MDRKVGRRIDTSLSSPFESAAELTPTERIDAHVLARLKRLGIQPARICSDEVFVRRVYLDAIGTLPGPQEARDFLQDKAPTKRRALIEAVLARDEFADYWSMKWADLLRVKSEFPINLWPNAVQAYHHWIHTAIKGNLPYDRFARQLLASSGSNFRDPPVNFYRAMQDHSPQGIARTVALTFMGARAEKWPTERQAGMSAFFSQVGYKSTGEWKEEIVYWDLAKPSPREGVLPDGRRVKLSADRDPRRDFSDWLISPKNPWFARCLVNRIWCWLMGRGVIHEPDDVRPDNPPVNPELMAYLERELIAGHFDLKRIYRLILNSQTYQLSSIPRSTHPQAAANFASYPIRRLEAEVLIDALNRITGTTERYSSAIPEPFTFMPDDQRSISLADGSITSAFLEMFGRPPRDTGLDAERNNRPTSAQRLHLLNSSHIRQKIDRGPALAQITRLARNTRVTTDRLYLAILSRFPTDDERATAEGHLYSSTNPIVAANDLAWALINSAEFLYRH